MPFTPQPVAPVVAPPVAGSARVARFAGLDGLRGLAALVVLLHHVLLVQPSLAQAHRARPGALADVTEALVYSPLHLAWAGAEAVLVFFVLSGLVLSAGPLALRGAAGRPAWSDYYPRRFVRLYVPVAAAVLIALPQARWLRDDGPVSGASWVYDAHVGSGTVGNALRDASLVHEQVSFLDGPLWSLHWEVLFSLALPAYLLLGRFRRTWQALGLVGALLVLSAAGAYRDVAALELLPVFGLGVVVAGVLPQARELARRFWWQLLGVSGLLLTSTWSLRGLVEGHVLSPAATGVSTALTTLGALLLVLAFLDGPAAVWAARSSVVRWLGRRSFSLYLVHAPIVITVAFLLGGAPSLVPLAVLAVPLSLLAAEAFGRLVEEPAHRLSRRVGAWVAERARGRAEQPDAA